MGPAAGILAGLFIIVLLSRVSLPVRLLAGIVTAAVVAGASFVTLPARQPKPVPAVDDPAQLQARVEQNIFLKFPAIRTLAQGEPEAWRETRGDIAEVLEVHGEGDPARTAALAGVLQRLTVKLRHGAAAGSDAPVLALLDREAALVRSLQHDNTQQCANEVLGAPIDLAGLPKDDSDAFQAMQAALVAAYLDGGRTAVAPPSSSEAADLLQRAMDSGPHPFSPEEQARFARPFEQKPDAICDLTLSFYANVQTMPQPQAAALIRSLLSRR
jgi:hypothetical protein